ncbi:serine protease [bacterium]|nr:serine protease [bacterium]
MNDLNKQQLILLCVLVSFIVSIATTVSIVTLLEEEPSLLPTTVNRIIERTVEKVIPGETKTEVVREDDLIAKAVQQNLAPVVTVMIRSWEVASEAKAATGIGFVASGDGMVVTDLNALPEKSDYFIKTSDGTLYDMILAGRNAESGVGVLALKDKSKAAKLAKVTFQSSAPELGATVVAIGGREKRTVHKGIISSIDASESEGGAERVVSKIFTTIAIDASSSGGPLLNTEGKVLGMNILGAEGGFTVPAQTILDILNTSRIVQ